MLKIRLARTGKNRQPTYRLVVSEHTKDTIDRTLEILGNYNPAAEPRIFNYKKERIQYWLAKGAQASPTIHNLLVDEGVIKGPKVSATARHRATKEEAAVKSTPAQAEKPAAEPTPESTPTPAEKPAEQPTSAQKEKPATEAEAPAESPAEEKVEEKPVTEKPAAEAETPAEKPTEKSELVAEAKNTQSTESLPTADLPQGDTESTK